LRAAQTAWERRRRDIKKKHESMLLEMSNGWGVLFDIESAQYAKEQRRALCRALPNDLSAKELRWMIYEDLIPEATVPLVCSKPGVEEVMSAGVQPCAIPRQFPSFAFDLPWSPVMPQLWKCNEVGHAMLTELAQTWYCRTTIQITNFTLISEFAISDRFQLGIVPREHIRRVELSFNQGKLPKLYRETSH
jgi:hypothetical protein